MVYSSRITGGCHPGSTNAAGIFLAQLQDGDVPMFGAGYGDTCADKTGAFHDMRVVDRVIPNRMGLALPAAAIGFAAPHGGVGPINTEALRSLSLDRGYAVADIAYRVDGSDLAYAGPSSAEMDWGGAPAGTLVAPSAVVLPTQHVLDVNGGAGSSARVIRAKRSYHRPGHAPGSPDAVIDLAAPSQDSMPRGPATAGIRPAFLYDLKAHGNAVTLASCGC